jgi:hypothetical protein
MDARVDLRCMGFPFFGSPIGPKPDDLKQKSAIPLNIVRDNSIG